MCCRQIGRFGRRRGGAALFEVGLKEAPGSVDRGSLRCGSRGEGWRWGSHWPFGSDALEVQSEVREWS